MNKSNLSPSVAKIGLILTGGGARAAYQAGALRAIAAMLPESRRSPFSIICGTSAGAINAAALAASTGNFQRGVRHLVSMWSNLHVNQVYRSDFMGVLLNGIRLLFTLLFHRNTAVSLLNSAPLVKLLGRILPFHNIQKNIQNGTLHGLSITAWSYSSEKSVTFYQSINTIIPWDRARRTGIPVHIDVKHLIASSAIPLIFPAEKIDSNYFCDGSMHQFAPISPALHLGAERVMIITTQNRTAIQPDSKIKNYPPLARVIGHFMSSALLDSLDNDLERLQSINQAISLASKESLQCNAPLRPIQSMVISPSEDIGKIAERHTQTLPRFMRLLFGAIGAIGYADSTLVSYLLFEQSFCQDLINLGYQDAMSRKNEILQFIETKDRNAEIVSMHKE